jgi:acetolactate synthase-1/2/3 large subunit
MSKERIYTVADAMIDVLEMHGVTTIFGYPGGAILPFYDALPYHPEIKHVLTRHEQGAAFMAQGWARTRKEIGVCVATSGPGGTNLVTGIADANLDSIPILCITGQVPLSMIGKDMFQEVDMTGVTLNITKHNYLVERAEDIVPIMTEAIHIAMSGRPGPVHIDVPKDIQMTAHPRHFKLPKITGAERHPSMKAYKTIDGQTMAEITDLLIQAKRPLLLVGHGVKCAGASKEIRALIHLLGIPTVTTLLGKGTVDHDSPDYLGMLGMHGYYHANLAVHNADLIFNIGSRFDDRIVGRYDKFAMNAQVIHVDIDESELGKVVQTDVPVHSDAKVFLEQLLVNPYLKRLDVQPWRDQIELWKVEKPYEAQTKGYTMRDVLFELEQEVRKNPDQYIIVTDVGQHQMWTSLSCMVSTPEQWLTSGGSGTMGFALPTAIGAAFSHPDKTIIAVNGDGGFQMNLQELSVIKDFNLNVKVLILNNSFLGMVRQWQELFYDNNYSAVAISSPDYKMLAEAYGLPGLTITGRETMLAAHDQLYIERGAVVAEFRVEPEDNLFPMVPGGKTLGQTIVHEDELEQFR